MRFVEWLSRLPQRMFESDLVRFVASIFTVAILILWTMWHLMWGPQIFALIPISIGLYLVYYAEENNLWWP